MPAWDDVLPESDRRVYEASGLGARAGFGDRPVLLLVDVTYDFVGDRREPILESIQRWRLSCGEAGWDAVAQLQRLVQACREREVPIVYTGYSWRPDGFDHGHWSKKAARAEEDVAPDHAEGHEFVREVAPQPQDIVFNKLKPSAFHGTPFLQHLVYLGADSVIVTGATTSGCVRASVVDAAQFNFRVVIPEECVWDRFELSHKVNLFDLNAKYADVCATDEVIEYVAALPQRPCGDTTPTGVPLRSQEDGEGS